VIGPVDPALVSRARTGDPVAFGRLVEHYHDDFLRFAYHLVGSWPDAEEAVQDGFVRAYRALDRYEERERFEAWLFRIVANRCRTAAVRVRAHERRFVADARVLATIETPGGGGDDGDWVDAVHGALAHLPSEQREAFLLYHVEDLGYDAMATITGAGKSALKMRVKRARERLRALLGDEHAR
jgi:RNA polymerase sigma-70 factor, ECF subfamily